MNTKAWDWSKNSSNYWLIPTIEAPYLAQRWSQKRFDEFLDLGCGLGRHSIFFAKNGFSVTAIDLSEYAITYVSKWADSEGVDIKTFLSDMTSLPFENNSMDCIMAYQVIYHTDTNGFIKTLEEIYRVLKPGGEIFLTLISKDAFSFKHADKNKFLDENTILRDDDETEMDVPHLYVDIEDIKKYFVGYSFEMPVIEYCEYCLDDPKYYSKHWRLLLCKNS